ncbi:NACHT domain- and WD repeat-containing protein 1 [Oryzias melastigma]|uniref:NACHT domain- and WD repeat-containing protein 1 n=1 Tax=Oryzias melastigma TaxID=30732 RepID=A0A834KX31_ORYME|nr:NACHT domain- and WD repeat-containing protein 1 [Oryzias melastigma]
MEDQPAAEDIRLGGAPTGQADRAQKTNSNMIRVFLSSGITDMSSERKALLEKAFPEVLLFCRGLGLVFEVVDLHWGIRNDPFGDHKACEISLQEIQMCKRLSAGPNFIVSLWRYWGTGTAIELFLDLSRRKQFEVYLSKLSNTPGGIKQLQQWFRKDTNALPPTYVLQPITAYFPYYCDLRPEKTQLLQLLRSAASEAEAAGEIPAELKRSFYTSVTEQELEQGLWIGDNPANALLFLREQKVKERPKRLAKFMDATANGLLDPEAQKLLTELKSQLSATSQNSLNLHCVELSRGTIDPKRKEHAQYLDILCQQFVSQMKARIEVAVSSRRTGRWKKLWGSAEEDEDKLPLVLEEAKQHSIMSAELCKGLHGREGILGKICLAMWESGQKRHSPLVVHGAAGMGKTALLCKVVQEVQRVLEARVVLVIRFLAACHPQRPDLDQVLHSACLQVSSACGLAPPTPMTASSPTEMQQFFRNILEEASQQGYTLLIVFDALEQLAEQNHTHKLHWVPTNLPPKVHLLVSMDTCSEAFVNMRLKTDSLENFFEVERLSGDEGEHIMESHLRASQRTLTPEQKGVVLQNFTPTGCPLHLKLILSAVQNWTSFTPLTEQLLGANTEEVMSQLLHRLEHKHGKELVGGALGYIALAREGLLEAELYDVMSLDDDVISEVYRYTHPPTPSLIRLPPLLWARLKRDLKDHLEERWTNGVVVIAFSSRRLSEVVLGHYLTSERQGRCHKILGEYFLGRWSGKLKPVALPGLSLLLSDRKVPPQPLWFAPGLANIRKLQALPYHLLHAGLWEELRQEVISSAEWLFCKSRVCGVSSVIRDLDQGSKYMDCTETGLIRDALALIKPGLDFLDGHVGKSQFYGELLARLSALSTVFPSLIGRLCSQINDWFLTCPEPALIPKCSFLQQPGGALQHTLNTTNAGVLCVDASAALQMLAAGAEDGGVAIWSLEDQQLLHVLLGHSAAVLTVKLESGAPSCLSVSADGSLRRWSLKNGQQLLCIQEAVPLDSTPSSVQLHLSEELLFVYTRTQVKVWGLDGGELQLCSSQEEVTVVLGLLGESVVSLCDSSWVQISHPVDKTQSTKAQLEPSGRRVTVVTSVTSPRRGKVLVVSEEGHLYQICRNSKLSAVEFPLRPSLILVAEDEKVLVTGCECTLSLFSIDGDSADRILELQHDDTILSACLSKDSRQLVSGAADQLIRVWSVTTGALLDFFCGSDASVTSLLFFRDFVVSASSTKSAIHLWNLKYDCRLKHPAHIPAGSAHAALTRDGNQIFYVHHQSQREVVRWNSQTGSLEERLAVSAEVSCLELAQHKRLLLCGLTSGTVLIYPLNLPQETLCIPPPESLSGVLCLAVSSQEKNVAVAYEDSVCLFEMATRDSFPTVEGPLRRFPMSLLHAPLSCMALLADRRLLYGTSCGGVRLQGFSGTVSELEPHGSKVTCVTASNWGSHALVGSQDGVQRLWALNPPSLDHTMEHKGFFFHGVISAAFSESDQFVFTGSQDRTIKVWDVASGKLLFVQYVYSPVVRMVTFRNGFAALTQQGSVIREAFRCPDHVSPDYNPLRSIRGQYRLTSRDKNRDARRTSVSDLQHFNPAQFKLSLMGPLRAEPSSACVLL